VEFNLNTTAIHAIHDELLL